MKTKSNAMKQNVTSKFILLFVAVLMSFNSYASIQEEPEYTTWLNEFVTLRIENKDSSLPLLKIKDYYNQLSDIDKGKKRTGKCNETIYIAFPSLKVNYLLSKNDKEGAFYINRKLTSKEIKELHNYTCTNDQSLFYKKYGNFPFMNDNI